MADIRPFRAIQYDIAKAGSLSDVIAPPYDVISPSGQDDLYRKHPSNIVRIDFGKESPTDTDQENRYTRAAATYGRWMGDGTLRTPGDPAFYVYEQTYSLGSVTRTRHALVGLVRLEPYGQGRIFPHEETHAGPKADRLALLSHTRAAFSQIFALYEDRDWAERPWAVSCRHEPPVDFEEPYGGHARVWRITDAETIARIQSIFKNTPLYIADGHHRYETSLRFRELAHAQGADLPGADWVPMACVSMYDPGLAVLPCHRAIRLPEGTALAQFHARLRRTCTLTPVRDPAALETAIHSAGRGTRYGMFDRVLGPTLVEVQAPVELSPRFRSTYSTAWQKLDLGILHGHVLTQCAGIPEDRAFDKDIICYTNSEAECLRLVRDSCCDVAFLVNPPSLEDLREIVRRGEKMPPKSTFFYPKLSSGLFIYDLARP